VPPDPELPPGGAHASEWLDGALTAIGVADPGEDLPTLRASAEDRARANAIAEALPAGFLAVHPGSGSPAKNWPAGRFAELVRVLGETRWLVVRGPGDDAASEPLERSPGVHVARDLPLRVLSALLARAGAYVGNDSGVSHLAATSGAPTVALFGPTDPALWRPLGPRVTVVRAGPTMESIAVEEVSAAVEAVRG
jgi:ADP-heptose:LPS heptosyltransferase